MTLAHPLTYLLNNQPGRIAGSLGLVLLAYWMYALAAVPLIEPQAKIEKYIRPVDPNTRNISAGGPHQGLEMLFSEHDWERQNPVVLENERGKLLIGEYKNNPDDGSVEIQPCTMIFLPDAALDDLERHRQAVVMQAGKAILLFDEPFDIKRGRIGKLTGGRLVGPIVIRSDQKQPGPADDLWIETRDVELRENLVRSPHPIKFRLGNNRGSGRDLRIELEAAPAKGRSRTPSVSGIRSFTLARDVRLHLVPAARESKLAAATRVVDERSEQTPGVDDQAKQSGPKQSSEPAGRREWSSRLSPESPIEVTCRGPFHFDVEKKVATFSEQVDVLQLRANGPSDQIAGEVLSIYFSAREEPAPDQEKPKRPSPRLDPSRLEIQGNPVTVRSIAENVYARGQRLEYDLQTRRASLEGGGQEVLVQRAGDEIHARSLHYQPGEAGRLGRFLAVGPGWLRAIVDDESKQAFEANWFKELRISVDPNSPQNDVISLLGEARTAMPGMGELRAEQIYAWVIRRPVPPFVVPPSGGGASIGSNDSRPPEGGTTNWPATAEAQPADSQQTRLAPNRMLASGNVQIDSVQLIGHTGQLEVWFEAPPVAAPQGPRASTVGYVADGSAAVPVVDDRAKPASATAPPPDLVAIVPRTADRAATAPAESPRRRLRLPKQDNRPQQRFEVGGNVVRLRFVETADDPELTELVIDGKARLSELQTARADQRPMLVEGELVHLVQPQPEQATVVVQGEPAHVEGGGLGLTGKAIHLDRAANRLWIDGDGLMTILVDRDLQGRPTEPQPMEVRWSGRMNFDGQKATFEKQVVARRQLQRLHTDVLEIVLTERVDFGSRPGKSRPEVGRIACRGGVFLDSRTLDEQGQLLSTEQIETVDLSLDQVTGEVHAAGPGWMKQIRRGDAALLDVPGSAPREQAKSAVDESGNDRETINYLYVRFQRGLGGNLHRRELKFGDRVRAVFGPVPNWESTLDPEGPEGLGKQGVELSCDQMQIAEMPADVAGKRFIELVASGNTDVEGTDFRALATRITYSAAKEQLVLEGDGRRDAELYTTTSNTGALKARKIHYWRRTGRVLINDFKSIDLNQIPSK